MAESSIPVDLYNPGQVFACIGFLEAAEALLGECAGGYDWRNEDAVQFRLSVRNNEDPVAHVLEFLQDAHVRSRAPRGSSNNTSKWGVDTEVDCSGTFPFPDPSSPATLPAVISDEHGREIVIDHWGDHTKVCDNVKFWAGAGGYPGAALAADALNLVQDRLADHKADPFAIDAPQSSSFRFDWRRDYIPIDTGFSLNSHTHITPNGYPLVELMAAIGLSRARPVRHSKLEYTYGVAGVIDSELYDPMFVRAALGAQAPPIPSMAFRRFRMNLDWPGKENHARCITTVFEERSLV